MLNFHTMAFTDTFDHEALNRTGDITYTHVTINTERRVDQPCFMSFYALFLTNS